MTNVRRVGYRYQRTIAGPVAVQGHGFLTGAPIGLSFYPAAPDTGCVFVRTDLKGKPSLKACVANVTGTTRRTVLGQPPAQIEMVEHILAALAGLRIDNCVIEVNAPEPPGLDGSSHGFAQALRSAGITLQRARREIWATDRSLTVSKGSATLTWHPHPGSGLHMSYLLDYGLESPIGLQRHSQEINPEGFWNGLSRCRTFLLEEEAEHLRRQGLGSKTKLSDLLVFGPRGPIGNRLRFANEPARHKLLDLVGDLALFGHDLCGHVVGNRSGHTLNVALVRRLEDEMSEPRARPLLRAA